MTTTLQIYGNPKLPRFTAWVNQIESEFEREYGLSSWNEYIDTVTAGDDAEVLPFGLDPEDLNDSKRAWIEKTPYVRGDPSLDYLSEIIYGQKFDLEAPELEDRFEDLQRYLSMDIEIFWRPFIYKLASLTACTPDDLLGEDNEFSVTPELAQDFCTHILMWSYVHDITVLRQNT